MSSLHRALSADEFQELIAVTQTRTYAAGDTIFAQGDEASSAYLIRSGDIQLEMAVPGRPTQPVATAGIGDLLGEPALLSPSVRQLSARAVGDVTVDIIRRRDFRALRHSHRPVSFALMLWIARRGAEYMAGCDRVTNGSGSDASARGRAPELGTSEAVGCDFDPRPFLPRLPFFQQFDADDLAELLELGTLWQLPKGREILRHGQRSDRLFLVVRGAVEARSCWSDQPPTLFGPGGMVGVLAPLLDRPIPADCKMRESGVVLQFESEALRVLLTPARPISYRFLDAVCLCLYEDLERANRVMARTR